MSGGAVRLEKVRDVGRGLLMEGFVGDEEDLYTFENPYVLM